MNQLSSRRVAEREINKEQLRTWAINQIPEERIDLITIVTDKTEEEIINHVTTCLEHLCRWYNDPTAYIGKFVRYLLLNDFTSTVGMADSVNTRLLDVYATFIYQYLPGDYKEKAKKRFR